MQCNTQIYTHVGGNIPTLQFDIVDLNGDSVDISGKEVTFPIYKKAIGGGRALVSENDATITSGTGGQCEITLTETDVQSASSLDGYIKINHGGGNYEILPKSGSIRINVSAM